jgi:hypothetical protein
MKKQIEIPDSIVEKLELKTIKAKQGRKRYYLSNYITELLIKDAECDS